jgi:6-phosphogluconolactonase (cycloisomerase 2 family)
MGVFYAALDNELVSFDVSESECALDRTSAIKLPDAVQYVWPHPVLPVVYVAYSNRLITGGEHHGIAVCRRDATSGRLVSVGQVTELDNRPVHLTVDETGCFLLIAYNGPSGLTVHALLESGDLGQPVAPSEPLELGNYVHQVRVAPGNRTVVVPCRGNDATMNTPEDPGALCVFRMDDAGRLSNARVIAPNGGYGFGPRHVDFHPSRQWMYVSVERQNQLMMFVFEDGLPASEPACVLPTLGFAVEPPIAQLAGPIHLHPDGRTVYVSNRSDGSVFRFGRKVWSGGEDTIAVFRIDQETGRPFYLQSAPTMAKHCRTFSIHPGGRLLIAASLRSLWVDDDGTLREEHPTLSFFRIGEDGRLTFASKAEIGAKHRAQFWTGLIAA